MANANPPKKNQAWSTIISLEDYNNGDLKVDPAIAAGDFQISKDGGSFANFATLPVVTPAGSRGVLITFSATEFNADIVALQGVDQTANKEWRDWFLTINTTA